VKRREFITLVGGAAAWPLAAHSQHAERMRRVGILMPYAPSDIDARARVRAFREELRKNGWVSDINVQFDERWTIDNLDLIRSAATNLVELKSDVIVATGGRVIPVLAQTTRSIPIVVPGGIDPVGRGYAESLARPGGNITGFATMELSVIGKMLQTLKEIAPHLSRVTIISNPDNAAGAFITRSAQAAAGPLGIEMVPAPIRGLADIERVVAEAAMRPDSGVFVPLDLTINPVMEQTVAAIARHRLPAVYAERIAIPLGGLVFYGVDRIDIFRRAAGYVDRILKGEKPGDLPYQQPTKYELVLNRKAAKALGLEIPTKLLFTADEVIE